MPAENAPPFPLPLIATLALLLAPATEAQYAWDLVQFQPPGTVGELETCFDAKEGKGHDLVAQRNAIASPGTKRAFLAAGRRRAQYTVDSMQRMLAEEKEFDEDLMAIALSSDDSVLYTATERHVYREDISAGPPGPTTPHDELFFDLADGEAILDLKVLPAPNHDAGIYVLTQESLYVLTYDPLTQAFLQRAVEGKPDGLYTMDRMVVHQNVNGDWRSYVTGILNTPSFGKGFGIAVCDLGDPLGTTPDYDLQFFANSHGSAWDPRVNASGALKYQGSDAKVLVLRNEDSTTKAYIACGFERQVTVLDVMYAGEMPGLWTNELDPLSPPKAVLDRIVLNQTSPFLDKPRCIAWSHDKTLLHVLDGDQFWTVDPDHGAGYPLSAGPVNLGFRENVMTLVDLGPGPIPSRFVWAMTMGLSVSHIHRFRVNSAGVAALSGPHYAMSTADGAVAIPDPVNPENSVIYTPTMGGVVKFTTQDSTEPQVFEVDVASYQPATPNPAGFAHSTEQLAIGNLTGDPLFPDWHLYTASATGQVLDYALDANLDPQLPVVLKPPASPPCVPWDTVADYTYGTSVEFADLGSRGKWVLFDYIDRTVGEIALVAGRVDVTPNIWQCVVAADASILHPNFWSWHLDFSDDWAFIAYEDGQKKAGNGKYGGFVMFDLRDIGKPAFEAQSPVFVPCAPFDKVGGVSPNGAGNLLLASCANHEATHRSGNRLAGGVLLFSLDDSVSPPKIRRIEEMLETPSPAAEGGPNDDFKWANFDYFNSGYRTRHFRNAGRDTWMVLQYVGGWMHQFSYDPNRKPALDLDAVWHGRFDLNRESWEGYEGEGQDARIYNFGFGPRILNCQNSETFVVLKPFGG